MNLVRSGTSLQDAIAQVEQVTAEPGNEKIGKEVAESVISDEDWLNVYCGRLRSSIQDPSALERAALLYRHDRESRQAYKARSKDLVLKTRTRGGYHFSSLLAKVMWVEHPDS